MCIRDRNWHYDKNIVLTIQYEERRSADIIDLGSGDKYSQGNLYINKAQVGEQSAILTPEIPHLIDKKMDEQATVNNDYTASFTIQVNPSKVDLSGRKNLVITDELNNLTYIPGTMTVTRSDGKVLDLDEFVVDASENNTKLAITLEQAVLGAYSYDVKYKAKLTEMSDSGNGQTKYSNTAVYNNGPSSTSEGSVHFDQNWSWDTLSLKLIKYNKDTKELLPGAEFGIYTANGRLMLSLIHI